MAQILGVIDSQLIDPETGLPLSLSDTFPADTGDVLIHKESDIKVYPGETPPPGLVASLSQGDTTKVYDGVGFNTLRKSFYFPDDETIRWIDSANDMLSWDQTSNQPVVVSASGGEGWVGSGSSFLGQVTPFYHPVLLQMCAVITSSTSSGSNWEQALFVWDEVDERFETSDGITATTIPFVRAPLYGASNWYDGVDHYLIFGEVSSSTAGRIIKWNLTTNVVTSVSLGFGVGDICVFGDLLIVQNFSTLTLSAVYSCDTLTFVDNISINVTDSSDGFTTYNTVQSVGDNLYYFKREASATTTEIYETSGVSIFSDIDRIVTRSGHYIKYRNPGSIPSFRWAEDTQNYTRSNNDREITADIGASTISRVAFLNNSIKSYNKSYFEYQRVGGTVGGNNYVGFTTDKSFVGSYNLGRGPNTWSVTETVAYSENVGDSFTGNLNWDIDGTIINIAIDGETRKVFLGLDGVWINSGDPVNLTGEVFTIGGTDEIWPAVAEFFSSSERGFIVNGFNEELVYTPPEGYNNAAG